MRQKFGLACLVVFAALAFATGGSGARVADDDVRYFAARTVDDAFAKGAPLLEESRYKIHASRRTAPGMVEIHTRDTDIIHVLEGTATFITGGEIVGAESTAADEIRGHGLEGGTSRRLGRGDVVVVPAGTPHWFESVEGPLLYYVVKVDGGR